MKNSFLKNYSLSIILLASILMGAGAGAVLKERAVVLKPFGDVFLNLLFTSVVPLVFFSISSAVAGMHDLKRLGKILGWMMVVFVATGVVASLVMIVGVMVYPPASGLELKLPQNFDPQSMDVGGQIVRALSASDFSDILSKKNMLALIVFSLIMGLSAGTSGEKGRSFREFLVSGQSVMARVIGYIMVYAPVGLGAYFAYLVGVFGPELMGSYVRVMTLYYPVTIGYFFIAFTLYVYLAGGITAVKNFWANIVPTALTALATGSSLAAVPVNMESARRAGIPEDVREVVIPVGATIHMEGSCLSAIVKIALLFGLFKMDFAGPDVIVTAIGVALLSGTVMSGIPGGGFLGELLIVTLYGFPLEALPVISMVGTLVDPPATMVNATGDNAAAMLVSRIIVGKRGVS